MNNVSFSTIAALATALFCSPIQAQTPSVLGEPITAETVVSQAELVRLADALDAAVDAKDWAAARSLFTDEIDVDFTSLIGGEPATIPSDALIAGWSGNLTAKKTSFHLRGNHRITFLGGDRAVMLSHGYAWNRIEAGAEPENGDNPLWEVWGVYEHSFVKTPQGWRIDGMKFFAAAQRGNDYVRDTVGPK